MNTTDISLSKNQSTKLHGLAVVMMLFHHFFAAPENLTLLYFFNPALCLKLSWLCKLCVALFAFLSGYGMNSGCDSNSLPDLPQLYKKAFLRIIRLYSMLWLVMILFKGGEAIATGVPISAYEFIMNGLGLLYTYNGSWWYVFFYVVLCLIFPVIRIYLTRNIKIWKKAAGIVAIVVFVALFYFAALHIFFPYLLIAFNYLQVAMHPSIMLAFFAGIFVNEFSIYDKIKNTIAKVSGDKTKDTIFNISDNRVNNAVIDISSNEKENAATSILENKTTNSSYNKIIVFFLYVFLPAVIAVITCIARVIIAPSAAYSTFDFVMIPVLVLAYVLICEKIKIKPVGALFSLFGKYSTGMWLTHVLVMGITYEFVARRTRFVPLFFVAEVILSLIASIIVTNISNVIKKIFCGIAKR